MSRKEAALAVLADGGYFREALESSYRGGEKFNMRLRSASGSVVNGFGYKTYYELKEAGLLRYRSCSKSSVWPSEYVLKQGVRLMKIHKKVTLRKVMAAAKRSMFELDNAGFCIACGAEADGCEPDAREYECEACGEKAVYGAEELVLMMA